MKTLFACTGLAAGLLLTAVPVHAQGFCPYPGYGVPSYCRVPPQAPNACGPGFYVTNCCGATYGPCYCLRPPCEPFNGARPTLNAQGGAGGGGPAGIAGFAAHLYVRSPRDFFMVGDP